MLYRAAVFFSLTLSAALAQVTDCVGSIPITTFRLSASPAGPSSPVWMPIRQLNNLPSGYRVRYQPGNLPQDAGKDAAIALVLIPKSGDGQMTVLPPTNAAVTNEWSVPFDANVVMLVFAPQGFDEKRLTNLVTRDPALIAAMAEYAEQTKELEETLQALRQLDDDTETALQPGRPQTPTEQALLALVRALNPAVSSYDPLGAGQKAGPTTMMGRGANMFFENAGGVVPGGDILPSVKQFLMPDTEFRSVYGAGAESGAMTLCAQRQGRGRNKLAYVWAHRLTNSAAPAAQVAGPNKMADLAIGQRVGIPLKASTTATWDLLERVTDWALIAPPAGAPIHVPALISTTGRELRLDLRQFAGLPGTYAVEGRWDWGTVRLDGSVQLHRLDDLSAVRVAPDSQDKLVTRSGLVAIDLTGANLRFVNQAWLHQPESERHIAVDLPSQRLGRADQLRVELDTDALRPGPFLLMLNRIDGASVEIPVQVQDRLPGIDVSKTQVHAGDAMAVVKLTGTGLDRIDALESPQASIELRAGSATEREAVIRLRPGVAAGTRIDVAAKVSGRTNPLRFPGAFQIAPARPKITEAHASAPSDLAVTLGDGEIPAGSFVSFTLKFAPADMQPTLTVQCTGGSRGTPQSYARTREGEIFFTVNPDAVGPTGCKLTAMVETVELGASDPFPLGTILGAPRIERLTLTGEAAPGGFYAIVEGWGLEAIERTGWSATQGLPVADPPRPIAGAPTETRAKQSLRIAIPWPSPSPKAPLFVWLRGEGQGRATRTTP